MDWEIVVTLVCILLSFSFSASETALTSLGRLEVNRFKGAGGENYDLIKKWVKRPAHYLSIVLIANNIVNTAATTVFALWVNQYFHNYVASLMTLFTITLIIFSEILPKILAKSFAMIAAPIAMRHLIVTSYVLAPIVFAVNIILKLTGLSRFSHISVSHHISEEELTSTIQMATREGGIDRETGVALENLIEFPDTFARDIMTVRSKVKTLNVRMSLQDTLQMINDTRYTRYPVVRDSLDDIVGILHTKDLLASIHRGAASNWTKFIHPTRYESELTSIGSILRDMKRTGSHMVIVRNESGVNTGVLTLEDIIEEIFGEIRDEHDDPSEGGNEAAIGGPKIVSGDIPIVDFNNRYNAELAVDISYSTLNGYLISRTGGKIPEIGTMIVDEGKTFRIHSISSNGIAHVELIDHVKSTDISD